jgi:hypothetical protein
MASALVKDYVLWAKHIRDDPRLVDRVLRMQAGEKIELSVDGIAGTWAKMANGKDGTPTAGLRPLDRMKKVWGTYFRERKEQIVEIRAGDDEGARSVARKPSLPVYPPLARTEEERRAAFEALMKIAGQGWRSEGPYGPRDELYER